jgi:hypothetical protein
MPAVEEPSDPDVVNVTDPVTAKLLALPAVRQLISSEIPESVTPCCSSGRFRGPRDALSGFDLQQREGWRLRSSRRDRPLRTNRLHEQSPRRRRPISADPTIRAARARRSAPAASLGSPRGERPGDRQLPPPRGSERGARPTSRWPRPRSTRSRSPRTCGTGSPDAEALARHRRAGEPRRQLLPRSPHEQRRCPRAGRGGP